MFVRQGITKGLYGLRGLRGGAHRMRRGGLGCACSPKNLGQDDGAFSPDYDPFAAAPPGITVPYANEPSYSGGFDIPTPAPSGSGVIPVINNPVVSPLSAGGGIVTGVATPGVSIPSAAGFSVPSPVPPVGTYIAPTSATASYIPYLVLGLGAIAVIAVMKRR